MSAIHRFPGCDQSSLVKIAEKKDLPSRNPSTKRGSRYSILSKAPLDGSKITIPHHPPSSIRPYLIGAIFAVSLAALGFIALAGYKHQNNPSIPNNTWSDNVVAIFDSAPNFAYKLNTWLYKIMINLPREFKIVPVMSLPIISVVYSVKRFRT